MLTTEGTAKLLDFGLAKLTGEWSLSSANSGESFADGAEEQKNLAMAATMAAPPGGVLAMAATAHDSAYAEKHADRHDCLEQVEKLLGSLSSEVLHAPSIEPRSLTVLGSVVGTVKNLFKVRRWMVLLAQP